MEEPRKRTPRKTGTEPKPDSEQRLTTMENALAKMLESQQQLALLVTDLAQQLKNNTAAVEQNDLAGYNRSISETKAQLKNCPTIVIDNDGPPQTVGLNGVTYQVPSGKSSVPEPIGRIFLEGREQLRAANARANILAGVGDFWHMRNMVGGAMLPEKAEAVIRRA